MKNVFSRATIQNIGADKYCQLPISIPLDINYQINIVKELDKKCSEIYSLISDIKLQIEKLDGYKKSIITEAVTKGLDSKVEMKDSEIEWIGKMPVDWELKPFRYVLKERTLKNSPIITNERLSLSIGLGITLYSEKTTNLDRYKDDVSQYKVVFPGDLVMNSMNVIVGAVGVTPYKGCISPAYYSFFDSEKDHVTSKYYEYVFLTQAMRKILFSLGKGIMAIERGDGRINTCRLKVSKYDLNSIVVPVPPVKIQRIIVRFLNNKCSEINSTIKLKQQQLSKLEEYKKSLIYEYVTGKREVE